MNLRFCKLDQDNAPGIAAMSKLASAIVKEHFDPLVGPEQNDYMIAMFQTEESIRQKGVQTIEFKVKSNKLRTNWVFPHLGMRIVKTGIAVSICLIINYLFNGASWAWSIRDACMAVVFLIKPYKEDSWKQSGYRLLGVLLGAFYGLMTLALLHYTPIFQKQPILSYLVMGLGIILVIYTCVCIEASDAAALCCIVYIGVVYAYPNVREPLDSALKQVTGTAVGIAVAYLVNNFHLPTKKHPEYVFFVGLQDLVPHKYAHVSSTVYIYLTRLFDEGVKICLTTRWAPAFLISQLGFLKIKLPAIVLDGAATYDIANNKYLNVVAIPHSDVAFLENHLQEMNLGYTIFAIRVQSLLIYRQGPDSAIAEQEYHMMKRSPYRNYVDGTYAENDKIATIRILAHVNEMRKLERELQKRIGSRLRMARKPMSNEPDYEDLFFYHPEATIENRKEEILAFARELEEKEHTSETKIDAFKPVDIIPPYPEYRSERDTLYLLNRVKKLYEPTYARAFFMELLERYKKR